MEEARYNFYAALILLGLIIVLLFLGATIGFILQNSACEEVGGVLNSKGYCLINNNLYDIHPEDYWNPHKIINLNRKLN